MLRFRGLLADAGEPEAATPPVADAADVHAPPVVPPVEDGVGSPAVLVEVPLASHGTLVGERRVVLHVLGEGERVGLQVATLVLGVELRGGGVVVELEELELDFLTLAARHRVHDRLGRVLPAARGVECLLRGLGPVHARDVAGEHGAHHLDDLAERREEHHSEVVGPECLLDSFGAEFVAMLARRVTDLVGQIVDLAVGHLLGCGHGLIHGVILSVELSEPLGQATCLNMRRVFYTLHKIGCKKLTSCPEPNVKELPIYHITYIQYSQGQPESW